MKWIAMAAVSIGVPVYNGERYLAATLEALVGQTFRDLEIVISDNASTDGTAAICERFARMDPRVRVHRAAENAGAAANFNRVVALSSAPYFKWAAHDDLCAPSFVERCVDALERDPRAVLAYPRAARIDQDGRDLPRGDAPAMRTADPRPSVRFESILQIHDCYEVFGVVRRDALLRTPLMGNYAHGDGVLLARLALLGPFAEIPEPLFFPREHEDQSMRRFRGDYGAWAVWFDPKLRGKVVSPWWRMTYELLRSVPGAPLPVAERLACYRHLARWTRWRRATLLAEAQIQALALARRAADRAPWRRHAGDDG